MPVTTSNRNSSKNAHVSSIFAQYVPLTDRIWKTIKNELFIRDFKQDSKDSRQTNKKRF